MVLSECVQRKAAELMKGLEGIAKDLPLSGLEKKEGQLHWPLELPRQGRWRGRF